MRDSIFANQEFTASVWREGEWYVAQALEIDIATQGESTEEALENLREALELHFEEPVSTVFPQIHKIPVKVRVGSN